MVWQKIDDQFGVHKKVIRIPRRKRLEAIGLWLLVLNYSGRQGTDGVLEEHEIEECLGKPLILDQLVRVHLWHRPGHECESCSQPPAGGIVIHDFLVYNPDAASTTGERESKSEGGRHGNHVRWHEQRGVVAAGCEWCTPSDIRSVGESESDGITDSTTDRIVVASESPGPVPVPDPLTDVTYLPGVSSDPAARDGIDPQLAAIIGEREFLAAEATRLGVRKLPEVRASLQAVVGPIVFNDSYILDLIRRIIELASEPVQNADAYVKSACVNSPDEVRAQWAAVLANAPKGLVA